MIKMRLKRCRYAKICDGYSEESFTCNNDYEALDYCGVFNKLTEERNIGLLNKLKNLFG